MYNLGEVMREARFEVEQTGGGCTGFVLMVDRYGRPTRRLDDAVVQYTIADHATSVAGIPSDPIWGMARSEAGETETIVAGVPLSEAVRAVADAIEGSAHEGEVRDVAGFLWEQSEGAHV